MNMGRRPIFTHEDIKKNFLTAIRMGLSNEKACDYAGISEPTFYEWIKRGETDFQNGKTSTIYSKFFKDYKKAKSDFTMRHVLKISQAGEEGNWQASAWLLERRCPDDFGKVDRIKVNGRDIEDLKPLADMLRINDADN